MDKIPGLRKLGWSSVLGFHFLRTSKEPDYFEISLGLDNIGFGVFRLFRVDGFLQYQAEKGWKPGWVFGIKL